MKHCLVVCSVVSVILFGGMRVSSPTECSAFEAQGGALRRRRQQQQPIVFALKLKDGHRPETPFVASYSWGSRRGGRPLRGRCLGRPLLKMAAAAAETAAKRKRKRGPPKYDATALAREVFADPYFYDDDAEFAESCQTKREAAFGEATTVGDVRIEYFTRLGKGGGLARLVRNSKATDLRLEAYFAGANISIERLLSEQEVVPLDESGEVDVFLERRVKGGVPSALAVFQTQAMTSRRSYRLCYVLGSSGSGKTFFCLQHLKSFLNDSGLDSVTLYFKAAGLEGDSAVNWASKEAPAQVVAEITEALDDFIKDELRRIWDKSKPLSMHLCLVIDEAGASLTQGFFDNRAKVRRLLAKLRSAKLAQSGTVVVCGAGLLSQTFASDRDAYYFRMRPWTRIDLERVLDQFVAKQLITLLEPDVTSTIAEAIYSIPLLEALSTNARSAYFIVTGIETATNQTQALRSLGWQAHLSALVPGIVNEVVYRYTDSNGIQSLSEDQRRRVAAWILGALSKLKPGALELPEFQGLKASEASVAQQLLQLNLQRSRGTVEIVNDEVFSATITPALAIVLFAMAGVFTNLVSGWRGEEEVAALYAAKQAILERWSKHETSVRDMQGRFVPNRDKMTMAEFFAALQAQGGEIVTAHEDNRQTLESEFVDSLEEVSVYRLRSQIQSSKDAKINIPVVPKHSILVNAERASFADVIAPYKLLQTKHTSFPNKLVGVNLPAELNKCCLLKNSVNDRALRGLLALWDGSLFALRRVEDVEAKKKNDKVQGATAKSKPVQGSNAFPANLIKWQEVSDGVEYVKITGNGQVESSNFVLPGRPNPLDVTFVLSTNAERLNLTLAEAKSLIISEETLDGDMQVDPTKIPDEDAAAAWTSFENTLVPGVKLQFLFTRSGPATDEGRPATEEGRPSRLTGKGAGIT
jgi:hypothetical protein